MAPKVDKNLLPFEYDPVDDVKKASSQSDNPTFTPQSIKLNMNNWQARLNIHSENLLGKINNVLSKCPLSYALVVDP